jgi:hypothetical protein
MTNAGAIDIRGCRVNIAIVLPTIALPRVAAALVRLESLTYVNPC